MFNLIKNGKTIASMQQVSTKVILELASLGYTLEMKLQAGLYNAKGEITSYNLIDINDNNIIGQLNRS